MRKEVPLKFATRLINHGPVVLVSSSFDSKHNITPVAWNMPVQKDPPMVVLEIGENHFIFECIMATGDFVINIPEASLAKEVVKCGSVSGREVDKFNEFALEAESSKKVNSPTLKNAAATLECELVRDEHLLKEYNMVVGKVKYASAKEGAFSDHWLFDKGEVRTIHHLGDKTFCFPGKEVLDLRGGI